MVCPGCPLSHRTKIVHALKRLEGVLPLVEVRPVMGPNGREFGTADRIAVDPTDGRHGPPPALSRDRPSLQRPATRRPCCGTESIAASSPTPIATSSACSTASFDAFTGATIDLRPPAQAIEIEAELVRLAGGLLGVVYRMGFSRQQEEFDGFAATLARTVRQLAADLADRPFLLGDASPSRTSRCSCACCVTTRSTCRCSAARRSVSRITRR